MSKKSIFIFLACFISINAILFLIPINLFDGEIVFDVNGIEFKQEAKLSLSYFIGIGASGSETQDVKDFYLKPIGYMLVFLINFALPTLITYRIVLKKNPQHDKDQASGLN